MTFELGSHRREDIFKKEKELEEKSTCAFFAQVQKEGSREVTRNIPFYNLDIVIFVGYDSIEIVESWSPFYWSRTFFLNYREILGS